MQIDDLPLFRWTPPCRVMAFPLDKRIGRVRSVAEKLVGKRGHTADAYWRQTVKALAGQMERAGIPKAEIDIELRAFFDAVQAEMIRLTYRGRRPGGDAA
jgi:hypothetical protein